MNFRWIAYAFAVGAWNTVLTGVLVGGMNLTYAILGHPLLTRFNIISAFVVGYIILFMLNVKIVDEI